MSSQLLFTSAARTLAAGQSGYGTVARSAEMRDAVAQRLEQLSYYHHQAPGAGTRHPVIFAYRILDIRGVKYHVLSRIQDAGLDFTSRTNYLAHHLVFEPHELPRLAPPAVIFQVWNGWRSQWREEPRLLGDGDWGNLAELPRSRPLPARAWQRVAGDAGSAAGLISRPYSGGCLLTCPPGFEDQLVVLYGESLQLLDPSGTNPGRTWEFTFTTFLQAEDNPAEFVWRGCVPETPGWQAAQRGAGGLAVSIESVPAPDGELAEVARRGYQAPVPTTTTTITPRTPVRPGATAPGAPSRTATRTPLSLRGLDYEKDFRPPPGSTATFARAKSTANKRWQRFIPALAALLLLVGLGVFKFMHRASPPAPGPVVPPEVVQPFPAVNPGPEVVDINPPISVPKPPKDPPKTDPRSPAISPAMVELLEKQFDEIRTLLVLTPEEESFRLPQFSPLTNLLHQLFRGNPPLMAEQVECWLTFDALELGFSGTAAFSPLKLVEAGAKSIGASEPAGRGYRVECANWYRSPAESLVYQSLGARRSALAALFRPVKGNSAFDPFRLLAVDANNPPAPLKLPKSLVRSQNSALESLEPTLRRKLSALQLPGPQYRWELLPYYKTEKGLVFVYRGWSNLTPPRGQELNFGAVRARLRQKLNEEEPPLAQIKAWLDANPVPGYSDYDLGAQMEAPDNFLHSFEAFAKYKKAGVAEKPALVFQYFDQLFRKRIKPGHLDNFTRNLSKDDALKLKNLQPLLVAGGFSKLTNLPPDCFYQVWEKADKAARHESLKKDRDRREKEVKFLRDLNQQLPESLAQVDEVHLRLAHAEGGPALVLIRFVDLPPAPRKP